MPVKTLYKMPAFSVITDVKFMAFLSWIYIFSLLYINGFSYLSLFGRLNLSL
jgi:hypothetical protein